MRNLSYNTKRVVAGCLTLLAILCLINYYAGLNWFGKYGAEAIGLSVVVLFIDLAYIGPSIPEMEENRKKKYGQK